MAATKRKAPPSPTRLAPQIIKWFCANARDLPWRHTLDPYAVWVSEIMLQQTQVRTVIPFWNRWMKRLPTIAKLANAREPTILKLWEGLGYYSRVRNLQKAARQIQEGHQGAFPTNPLDIKALIGVGRYTGGAISSIAFDLPEPILDGNVIRVLTRVFGIVGDPKSKVVNERLWDQAGELVVSTKMGVSASRADSMVFAGERSLLNQGMMELGATVCLPSNPDCGTCRFDAIASHAKRTGSNNSRNQRNGRLRHCGHSSPSCCIEMEKCSSGNDQKARSMPGSGNSQVWKLEIGKPPSRPCAENCLARMPPQCRSIVSSIPSPVIVMSRLSTWLKRRQISIAATANGLQPVSRETSHSIARRFESLRNSLPEQKKPSRLGGLRIDL